MTFFVARINLEDELKMHREYRQKQISQNQALQQSRGSKTDISQKKSPKKACSGGIREQRISEVTREESEYT